MRLLKASSPPLRGIGLRTLHERRRVHNGS